MNTLPPAARGAPLIATNELDKLPLSGPEPFDIRPQPPVDDFCAMIDMAGLTYLRTVATLHPSLPVHLMMRPEIVASFVSQGECLRLT